MEHPDPGADPWWAVFWSTYVATSGLLLLGDRYVELLAAGAAYAATWVIVRAGTRPEGEGTNR